MIDKVLSGQPSWLADGNEGDVVLSCRVRLARNLAGMPFPSQAQEAALAEVLRKIGAAQPALEEAFGQEFSLLELEALKDSDRMVLVEKHLISPLQADNALGRAVLVSEDNSISIMINEEDHLRIQVMRPGLDLARALAIADEVDNILEEIVDFAFDEYLGYLTACPTNIGTALRATAMLHMPGLVLSRQVDNMARAAAQVGLNVRGMYGEGSEVLGDIFQVSNQLAMGCGETELVDSMTDMVRQIAAQERLARQQLLRKSRLDMEDMVWRAYGVLSSARRMENTEAMGLYSRVLLGIDLHILTVPKSVIYQLMVSTRPNHVAKKMRELQKTCSEQDFRAFMIREKLKEVNGQ